ncbi:MAG: hypothetical protein MZV64_02825 [Ignavibacteriales bacterium]|nr:hypothetical protein [Ignavibacteriales bacterium]
MGEKKKLLKKYRDPYFLLLESGAMFSIIAHTYLMIVLMNYLEEKHLGNLKESVLDELCGSCRMIKQLFSHYNIKNLMRIATEIIYLPADSLISRHI